MSFSADSPALRTLALLLGLGAYTLILATTACILIRVGNLWDDLRSLLLLIVMIFLAMAMSGDDAMCSDRGHGAIVCFGGFLFSILVTEAVLRVIRLRLSGWYRTAYYLILALVFLYPIVLRPLLTDPEGPWLQWALFGFSPLSALALVTLVPAARRGRAYVKSNGSPWHWPLYPWSLFVVMAIGLAVRAFTLCVSFHFVGGRHTIFGPYFLVPIGMAVSLIWLEIAIVSRRPSVMLAASAAPLGLVALALMGHSHDLVYQRFLRLFIETLHGSPAYLALVAAIMFLTYAAARGVRPAWELMAVGLISLCVIDARTVGIFDLVSPRWPPVVGGGLVMTSVAWSRRNTFRALVAAGLLVAGSVLGCGSLWPDVGRGVIAVHLTIMATLIVGALFDDRLAQIVRSCGAFLLLMVGLFSAIGYATAPDSYPPAVVASYPGMIAVAACAYGFLVRDLNYVESALVILTVWLARSGWLGYLRLRKSMVGLDQIGYGLVFFAIALAISLRKAGLCVSPLESPMVKWLEQGVRSLWEGRGRHRLRR